jgi:hypothetical protein
VIDYEVEGNWKLVWENNRECFHCPGCHPQYVKANFDIYEEAYASPAIREQMAAAVARTHDKWAAEGLAITHAQGGLARFPDPDLDLWYAADRTVMVEGYESESMDGARVAPLMGDYQDSDVGVLRMRSMVNFWVHGSCVTRSPHGSRRRPAQTRFAATVVDQFAQEGAPLARETLLFWHLTNQQDWEISRWQQKGVDSIGYEPGLSRTKNTTSTFIRWYLKQMRAGGASGGIARPHARRVTAGANHVATYACRDWHCSLALLFDHPPRPGPHGRPSRSAGSSLPPGGITDSATHGRSEGRADRVDDRSREQARRVRFSADLAAKAAPDGYVLTVIAAHAANATLYAGSRCSTW